MKNMPYFRIKRRFSFILGLILYSHFIAAQSLGWESLPRIKASAVANYDIEQGLSAFCLEEIFRDSIGRLWLNPCRDLEMHQGDSFFQFDGNKSYTIPLNATDSSFQADSWFVNGVDQKGQLFGADLSLKYAFIFDPGSRKSKIFSFRESEKVMRAFSTERGIMVITQSTSAYVFYRITLSQKEEVLNLPMEMSPHSFLLLTPIAQFGSDIWFLQQDQGLVHYDVLQNRAQVYQWKTLSGFDKINEKDLRITATHTGELLIFLSKAGGFYLFDKKSESLSAFDLLNKLLPSVPDLSRVGVKYYQDETGNLIVDMIYSKPGASAEQSLVLLDTSGQLFDFQSVITQISLQGRYSEILIDSRPLLANYVSGSDFKKEALISTDGGLFAVEMQSFQAVKAYLPSWAARGIIELNNKQLLVITDDSYCSAVNPITGISSGPLDDPGRFLCGEDLVIPSYAQFVQEGTKVIWLPSEEQSLIRFNTADQSCEKFKVGQSFEKFALLNKTEIALVNEQNELYIYNFGEEQLRPFLAAGVVLNIGGKANELYVDQQGQLWIASLNGLWLADVSTGTSQHIDLADGLMDRRVMCIHESEEGKLWLGLMAGGLHIYDPASKEMEVIDITNGLSNNTVVGILADEDGDRWVSTFSGITVLSPEREVLFKLYEKDGLSHKEFNRYSYLKTQSGQLVFGTVAGINVLESGQIKDFYQKKGNINIYLTEVEHFDRQTEREVIKTEQLDRLEKISLPATHRYLKLNFSLSDYIHTQQHTFAYKLVGAKAVSQEEIKNGRWTDLGNSSELSLNNIPIGEHTLLIRGKDHKGQVIDQMLQIPLRIRPFFYKTWWFYLICSLPFLLMGLLWARRTSDEKKRLEMEVSKRTLQIEQDKELIEKQAAELQELDEMKSRFFTNISHEFRTPLTVITGMSNQIKQNPDQWLGKGLELIQRNSEQLLSLINQILDLRKLESGALKVQLIQSDILTYIRYITGSFAPLAQSNGIKIHFLTDLPNLQMDYAPDKLLHIISNLLSNAIKYTPEGGDIYVHIDEKTDDAGRLLSIQIKDTGQGISPEALPYIFDRFYQVENLASQKPQGSGIGLALTHELVHLLGGSISVKSKPKQGTTFTLLFSIQQNAPIKAFAPESLPPAIENLAASSEAIVTETQTAKEIDITSQETSTAPSLLIVEDNEDVRLYLRTCLQDHYRLIMAQNGQEGIDFARSEIPDLIISDVMMPIKNGYELCETLKEDERTSHIPIVILSAKADFESKLTGLHKKADAYLTKPFQQEELQVTLKNLFAIRRELQRKYANTALAFSSAIPLPQEGPSNLENVFLEKLQQFILDHIDDTQLSTERICQHLGMSKANIYRKLKALTNLSLSHFIRQIRLQKAQELLLNPQFNISEVAYAVGFADPYYFSRIFSETFKQSPTQFRSSNTQS
ncbi:MAG: response regulator [Saprospiraceae bacterium]|nr:response regulator [Saprospiraceae bacterium]